MSYKTEDIFEFENFRFEPTEKLLNRDGSLIPLTPKVCDTLKVLVENAGHLITRDEMMQSVWNDRFVDETNLTFNIKMLRKALGDDAANPRFIETVPRRGYRFVASVVHKNGTGPAFEQVPARTEPANNEKRFSRSRPLTYVSIGVLALALAATVIFRERDSSTLANVSLLSTSFNVQKLSTSGEVVHAVISPDGSAVAYTNGVATSKQSVWLRQLETGNNVEIIPPSDDKYFGLAFSPDGNFLYFTRRNSQNGTKGTIYRVSIFGGVPRRIIEGVEGWINISPDGGKISFVRCPGTESESCSLWIADAVDGQNELKLASRVSQIRITASAFSPDGKTLAFAAGQTENTTDNFSLMGYDLASGEETELTNDKFCNLNAIAWLPDGRNVLIAARKAIEPRFRIWQVNTASGESHFVSGNSENLKTLTIDRDASRLVSTSHQPEFHLRMISLEPGSTDRDLSSATSAKFTPNGKIVVSSYRTGNNDIWSMNSDGGELRQLTNDPSDDGPAITSRDGSTIYFSSTRSGDFRIWQMKSDGADQIELRGNPSGFPISLSPDGDWLYYQSAADRSLRRISLKSSEDLPVIVGAKLTFDVSPDGKNVAYTEKKGDSDELTIARLSDGSVVRSFAADADDLLIGLIAWTPDSKSIVYETMDPEYKNRTLLMRSLTGEKIRQITTIGDGELCSLAVAPDGLSIGVTLGSWRHDASLITGLK